MIRWIVIKAQNYKRMFLGLFFLVICETLCYRVYALPLFDAKSSDFIANWTVSDFESTALEGSPGGLNELFRKYKVEDLNAYAFTTLKYRDVKKKLSEIVFDINRSAADSPEEKNLYQIHSVKNQQNHTHLVEIYPRNGELSKSLYAYDEFWIDTRSTRNINDCEIGLVLNGEKYPFGSSNIVQKWVGVSSNVVTLNKGQGFKAFGNFGASEVNSVLNSYSWNSGNNSTRTVISVSSLSENFTEVDVKDLKIILTPKSGKFSCSSYIESIKLVQLTSSRSPIYLDIIKDWNKRLKEIVSNEENFKVHTIGYSKIISHLPLNSFFASGRQDEWRGNFLPGLRAFDGCNRDSKRLTFIKDLRQGDLIFGRKHFFSISAGLGFKNSAGAQFLTENPASVQCDALNCLYETDSSSYEILWPISFQSSSKTWLFLKTSENPQNLPLTRTFTLQFNDASGNSYSLSVKPNIPIRLNLPRTQIVGLRIVGPINSPMQVYDLEDLTIFEPEVASYKEALNIKLPTLLTVQPKSGLVDGLTLTKGGSKFPIVGVPTGGGIKFSTKLQSPLSNLYGITLNIFNGGSNLRLPNCFLSLTMNWSGGTFKKNVCGAAYDGQLFLPSAYLLDGEELKNWGELQSVDWAINLEKQHIDRDKEIKIDYSITGWGSKSAADFLVDYPILKIFKRDFYFDKKNIESWTKSKNLEYKNFFEIQQSYIEAVFIDHNIGDILPHPFLELHGVGVNLVHSNKTTNLVLDQVGDRAQSTAKSKLLQYFALLGAALLGAALLVYLFRASGNQSRYKNRMMKCIQTLRRGFLKLPPLLTGVFWLLITTAAYLVGYFRPYVIYDENILITIAGIIFVYAAKSILITFSSAQILKHSKLFGYIYKSSGSAFIFVGLCTLPILAISICFSGLEDFSRHVALIFYFATIIGLVDLLWSGDRKG